MPGTPPEASDTTLAAPPLLYPSDGPTPTAWLYSQLQNAVFPGSANTFTAVQTFTQPITVQFTDTGGGSDTDLLRPPSFVLEHDTTLQTVAGVGTSIECWVKDAAGTRVRIARDVAEITTTTGGAVDSTRAFCLQKGNEEIEAMRIRGAAGQAKYSPVGGTTGTSGKAGGEVLIWGSLNHFGSLLGFFGSTPISKPSVSGSRGGNAALASLLTQLAALGLLTDGSTA